MASFPLGPSTAFPTFLLDFNVFPGNSGGPVYVSDTAHRVPVSGSAPAGFIAGMLTQQVELNSQNLSFGIVTDARFVRETLSADRQPQRRAGREQGRPARRRGAGLMSAEDAAYSR